MNIVKQLGKKSIHSFWGQIIGQCLSFLWVFLIGRILGSVVYGDYLYVYTVITLLLVVSKIGFENAIVYYISRTDITEKEKEAIVSFSFKAVVIVSLAVVVLCETFNIFISDKILNRPDLSSIVCVLAPIIIFESLSDVCYGILKGEKKILQASVAQYVITMTIRVLGFCFMEMVLRVDSVLSIIIPHYVGCFISIVYAISQIDIIKTDHETRWIRNSRLNSDSTRKILTYSLPLLFMNVVMLINHNADKYMLGYMLNSSNVAIYTVALYIGAFSTFVLTAINSIFAPTISELYSSGRVEELDYLYKTTTRWVIIVNLAIFALTLLFPREIMSIVGEEFEAGSRALVIVMIGQMINAGVGSVGWINSMTGHSLVNMITAIIAVLVNVCLNFVLIPRSGMVGAAVASAVSLGLQNILNLAAVNRYIGIWPYYKKDMGALCAFFISSLLTYGLRCLITCNYMWRLLIGGGFFAVVYSLLTFLLSIEDDEKEYLRRIVKWNKRK